MPSDPDDRNDPTVLWRSKIRDNEKEIDFFIIFYIFAAQLGKWRVITKNGQQDQKERTKVE